MWRCCGWAALRGLGNGQGAERTSPTVPQVQVCTLVVTAGEGLITPLRSSSLVGNPSGERSSILLGHPGRGRNPQVSQAGNAGKPDNEDEYRHRPGACATALGRSRAKLSFQFDGTLSSFRSGTASAPSRICHTAPGRGGHEPPCPPDWRLAMSLEMCPRPPGREGRAPGWGRPLRVALAALSITAAVAALIAALLLLLSDCAGGPDGSDPASLRSVSQAVEERSISTMRAVRPSSTPEVRTRPAQRRTSPHARARCASCRAFQRQLS